MFSPPVRLILTLLMTYLGVMSFRDGDLFYGTLCIVTIGLLISGYFRHGPIRPAFLAYARGDIQQARKLTDSIRFSEVAGTPIESLLALDSRWVGGLVLR